jgi:RNA polymerase sigma factor (sigma-70 family)
MVGLQIRGAPLTLLEFFRDRRNEIELLADDRALFLLSFICELEGARVPELVEHLGWPVDFVSNFVGRLRQRGFLRKEPADSVAVSDSGRRILEAVGLRPKPPRAPAVIRTSSQPGQSRWPVFTAAFPMGAGEERIAYESRLMAMAQSGTAEAFEALIRELWSFAYMRNLFTLGAPQDAEDATQSTFFKAFVKLRDYKRPSRDIPNPVRSWIGNIARSTSMDMLRGRRWEEPIDPEGAMADPRLDWLESHEPNPEQIVLLREHHEAISRGVLHEDLSPIQRAFHDAWEQLGPTDRSVLGMRHWDNLSFDEIAHELGLNVASARVRAHRAKEKLKQLMGPPFNREGS